MQNLISKILLIIPCCLVLNNYAGAQTVEPIVATIPPCNSSTDLQSCSPPLNGSCATGVCMENMCYCSYDDCQGQKNGTACNYIKGGILYQNGICNHGKCNQDDTYSQNTIEPVDE